jgi:hypothetical protein
VRVCFVLCCQVVVSLFRSQVATSDITEDSSVSKSNSKDTSPVSCPQSQFVPDYEKDGPSAVSTIAPVNLSSSLEVSQAPLPLVPAATIPEDAVLPAIECTSRSDEPPSTSMSCHATESSHGAIDDHAKQLLSQLAFWDPPPRRRRPNRTEPERIQEFHADPYVAEVEHVSGRTLCELLYSH